MLFRAALLALLVCTLVPARGRAELGSSSRRADRASEIEQRLFAPCCWTQTLDVHDSELSTSLRIEIRERLSRGESASTIEDALAQRYGERIRAVPREGDARVLAPLLVGSLMALSLLALLGVVRRGRRIAAASRPEAELDGAYDEALDRELRRREGSSSPT